MNPASLSRTQTKRPFRVAEQLEAALFDGRRSRWPQAVAVRRFPAHRLTRYTNRTANQCVAQPISLLIQSTSILGDLIPYQNVGKGSTANACKAESVSGYSNTWINMRHDNAFNRQSQT